MKRIKSVEKNSKLWFVLTRIEHLLNFISFSFDCDLSLVSEPEELATNHERINSLEFRVDELRNEVGDILGSL